MNNTVLVTSFWNRPMLLRGLYLSSKKTMRNAWRMLVVDNGSEGESKQWLYSWKNNISNIDVIRRESYSSDIKARKSSAEHGAALDMAISHLKGTNEIITIVDSDILWMKPYWDEMIFKYLEDHEHVTTCRKNKTSYPAPFLSVFKYDFIEKYNLSFAPRVDENLQVIRPTEDNDVGWMMNTLGDSRWKKITQAPPGIGYSKSLSLKIDDEIIGEHLGAGRKKTTGRILKWSSGCMNYLDEKLKELRLIEKAERKAAERSKKSNRSL